MSALSLVGGLWAIGKIVGKMELASNELMSAALSLMSVGGWLRMAAVSTYSSMEFLSYAFDRFTGTITNVDKISKAISSLVISFMMLSLMPVGSLSSLSLTAIEAIPHINELADSLTTAADKLQLAVEAFRGPADELVEMFDRIGSAAVNLQANVKGTSGTVLSESVSTVQVYNTTEGGVSDERQDTQGELLRTLQSINEKIEKLDNTQGPISDIAKLLTEYLPLLNTERSSLDNQMNSCGG
jgi:hypothetical protein